MNRLFVFFLCGMFCAAGCKKEIEPDDHPAAPEVERTITWELSSDGTLTISGKGDMPEQWLDGDFNITTPWAEYNDLIINVVIDDNITFINRYAFMGCTGLTSINVNIGNTVYSSEDGVLYDKKKTTLIKYPAGKTGFYIIPNDVSAIRNDAFRDCAGLTSITLPNSITEIGWDAFRGCNSLSEIVNYQKTPQPVYESGYYSSFVFGGVDKANCTLLVPDGSVEAYRSADVWKYFCKTGVIGDPGSISIGGMEGTLRWSLTAAGDTLTFYGEGYISGNTINYRTGYDTYRTWNAYRESVTHLIINEGIFQISDNAFMWDNLTGIEVSAGNPYLSSINGVLFNKDKTILIKYPANKNDVSYTIPGSVTEINNNAFRGCKGLTSVTIPNSVTTFGYYVFQGCTGLVSFTVPNIVFESGSFTFLGCSGLTSVTIPDGVTTIGSAFAGCTGLTSVTIPNSVTVIGDAAFSGCTGLKSISIPNSVTSIGANAFDGCTGLSSITIPNSVSIVGRKAFHGCTGLTSVTIPDSVTEAGSYTFQGCTGLTSVVITNSITQLNAGMFLDCTSLVTVTIPNGVTEIGNAAFENCSGLTSVTLPGSVTSIGANAFQGCTGLTSLTIPGNVTDIGICAFHDCTGLTEIINLQEIPPTLARIYYGDVYVFEGVKKTTCTLFVPAGSVSAYRTADGWKDFVNIKAIQ